MKCHTFDSTDGIADPELRDLADRLHVAIDALPGTPATDSKGYMTRAVPMRDVLRAVRAELIITEATRHKEDKP